MKRGPFQLDQPEFPAIEVRAFPGVDEKRLKKELPVSVSGLVTYDVEGTHFAALTIRQESEEFAYGFKIQVFTTFTIDVDAAKEMFRPYNPAVVAVNVARILYSGAREMLAIISSRGPYGAALLPTLLIEPTDIVLEFEDDKHEQILAKYFAFSDEQINEVNAVLAQKDETELAAPKPKKGRRKQK